VRRLLPTLALFCLAGCILGGPSQRDRQSDHTGQHDCEYRQSERADLKTITRSGADAPWHVSDTVRVRAGERLVIEPGVDVVFDADVPVIVEGVLDAVGTATDSIRFLRGAATEWGGLRFEGDTSSLSFVRISGANAHEGHPCIIPLARGSEACSETGNYRGGAIGAYGVGTALVLSHVVLSGNRAASGGGLAVHSGPRVCLTDCAITGNVAWYAGGVSIGGTVMVSMTGCTVSRNRAGGVGGGITIDGPTVEPWKLHMRDCVMAQNESGSSGGAIMGQNMLLEDCTIENNMSNGGCGGTICASGDVVMDRCVVRDNRGGITFTYATGHLTDCLISGNWDMGGVEVGSSVIEMANCTVTGNSASSRSPGFEFGGIYVGGGGSTWADLYLRNSIVWGNKDRDLLVWEQLSRADVAYSDIGTTWPGSGNISADPFFRDPARGDYRLRRGSPAADAGDPHSAKDPDGTQADMGARLP